MQVFRVPVRLLCSLIRSVSEASYLRRTAGDLLIRCRADLEIARSALSQAKFMAARAAGEAFSLDQAFAFAARGPSADSS